MPRRWLLPGEVTRPGEREEGDGGHVVDEHLYEVLPLDIEPLRDGEGPVEGELDHVVPPDGGLNVMVRVLVPATSRLFIWDVVVWRPGRTLAVS